jgi:peptidoglycan/xylan/chitin deacetylase (PgdA/CDA1 family)
MDNPIVHCEGNPGAIKVLMYHRIVGDQDECNGHWTCVGVTNFRKQLEMIDRWGFTPITFEDYRLFRRGELSLPRKPIILTFDDGYLDTYTFAYPILREFGVKAVVFVVAEQRVESNYWDRHLNVSAAPLMKRHHILEMHEAGFEIGSHSLTHPNLTQLPEDQAWEEVSRSRILLEILLNATVSTFAYPYGATNPVIKRMAADAGYDVACSVATGPAVFCDDPYEVRRIPVPRSTRAAGFGLRVLTPFQYYGLTRWKVGNALSGSAKNRKNGPAAAKEQQKLFELSETKG